MFSYFERFIDPFPAEVPDRPPQTLLAFIWHYAKPVWPYLALISLSGAFFAVVEVALFRFPGQSGRLSWRRLTRQHSGPIIGGWLVGVMHWSFWLLCL